MADRFLLRFGIALGAVATALGLLIRVRVIAGAPLPPSDPGIWLLLALRDDVLAFAAVVLVTTFVFRRMPRTGAVVLTIVLLALVVFGCALLEGWLCFGHAVRSEDLQTGFHPLIFTGSASGGVLITFLILLALYAAGVAFAIRARSPLTRDTRGKFASSGLRPREAGGTVQKADEGALQSRPSSPLWWLLATVVVLGITAILFPAPETGRNALFAMPELLRGPTSALAREVVIPKPDIDLKSVRELAGKVDDSLWLSDDYPLARRATPRSAQAMSLTKRVKPNFVFIVMESMRAEEMGVYGNDPPGVTPNIDALARDGIRIDDAYSAGSVTPEGEAGVLYGAL